MATNYHFKTDWRFKAPLDQAWDVILDIEHYPTWWKDFRRVVLRRGDGRSVGSVFECETRGSLPYTVTYTLQVVRADRPRVIELQSTGDLVGTGRWEFSEPAPGETRAVYYWDVATTRPILNLVAPLARSFLARNHEQVMARGFAALRPYLEQRP